MVDVVRGVVRVRRWPKKRGPPKSAAQAKWVEWFKQANLLAKYADAASIIMAMRYTKFSGLYPRDILLKAMRGRLYNWTDETGWRYFSVAAIGDISETLDVLAQTVGSVLVRAADRWRAPPAGPLNSVLTYKGAANPPVWEASAGGLAQGPVPGTPITPDGTQNAYVIDVSSEFHVELLLDKIGFASADRTVFEFSIDGGVSFKNGASDYVQIFLTPTSSGDGDLNRIHTTAASTTAKQDCHARFDNLTAGRGSYSLLAGRVGSTSINRQGFANFDGQITDIRIFSHGGANFNAGVIRAVGLHP